jgi:membrane protein
MAEHKHTPKVSVSMSDPTPGPKGSRARLPYHLAPWVAVAAMAAAALWPKKKLAAIAAAEPRLLTPAELDCAEPGRGRCATSPFDIPPRGWKDIFWRTYREMGRDRLGALAGGITYYILLATFPAIAAFVSLYGLIADLPTVERQFAHLSTILPTEAVSLIGAQMARVAAQRHATLGLAFVLSTLVSIWSANAGMRSMVDALNITFDEVEKREYVRRVLLTYVATLAALVFLIVVLSVLVGTGALADSAGDRRRGLYPALSLWP